jgi:uroporphyrin-III C-methyltransferase
VSRNRKPGTVYIVGAGPGDPGLLTLKAAQLLSRADVVVHDRLIHPDVLAHARSGARLIYAGKEGGGDSTRQEDIHRELIEHARLGRSVVRLKGGDPFVFGRGGEEALALSAEGIPWELVPGVSSGAAAPAAAGIPVTLRGVSASVTFATAHLDGGAPDWVHLAGAPTLVLFMAVSRLAQVSEALLQAGRVSSSLAAVVEAGTWTHQRVVEGTLGDIAAKAAAAEIGSPALLVVGEVVGVRQVLAKVQSGEAAEPRLALMGQS